MPPSYPTRRRGCAAMKLMATASHVESQRGSAWLRRRVARMGAGSPAARLMRGPLAGVFS